MRTFTVEVTNPPNGAWGISGTGGYNYAPKPWAELVTAEGVDTGDSYALDSVFTYDLDKVLAQLGWYWDNPYYGPTYKGRMYAVVWQSWVMESEDFLPEEGRHYIWDLGTTGISIVVPPTEPDEPEPEPPPEGSDKPEEPDLPAPPPKKPVDTWKTVAILGAGALIVGLLLAGKKR